MDQTLSDYFIILYGEAIGTKESKSQNWQGSFPKATTVAINVVVVQRNLTTTVR